MNSGDAHSLFDLDALWYDHHAKVWSNKQHIAPRFNQVLQDRDIQYNIWQISLWNGLAKLVTQNYHISSSATIQSLHWLPIKHRIDFKISTLTYKLLHSHTPPYLASTLHTSNPVRNLRSGNLDLLHQPFSSSAIGSRAFHVAAPAIWNSIPLNIRHSPSISSFRRHLKTHLFAVAD